jgi:hypothetical protein
VVAFCTFKGFSCMSLSLVPPLNLL